MVEIVSTYSVGNLIALITQIMARTEWYVKYWPGLLVLKSETGQDLWLGAMTLARIFG